MVPKPFQRALPLLTLGLLMVWGMLGGIAFAEQLTVLEETGSHDERALEGLTLAVKSGESALDGITILLSIAGGGQIVWSSLPLVTLDRPRPQFLEFPRAIPTLLPVLLSCWRI